ncbi:MAG: DUF3160 domain-containing protein [Promethearchaeota archaeon]
MPFPQPSNLNDIRTLFDLSPDEEARLLTEGVLVLGNHRYESLGEVYSDWVQRDIPIIVTTDAWLHAFHVVHEDILKMVEAGHLIGMLEILVHELQNASVVMYAALPPTLLNVTAAVYGNVVLFSVACRLLNDSWPVPGYASSDVDSFVTNILDASLVQYYPGEDYTQYKPRGHYAGNATLEAYFRCMKWLGRRIFQLDDTFCLSLTSRHIRQAVLFSEMLRDSRIGDLWSVIYNVTGRFAGYADSVTPTLIQYAVDSVFGLSFVPNILESEANVTLLKEEFQKEVYPVSQIVPIAGMSPSKYCQVMGERWIPDGAAYQQTTDPNIMGRMLPTALESMYTMAGSQRALELITEQTKAYPALEPTLRALRADIEANYTETDWQSCIYTNWFKLLATLVEPFDDSYPAFMNTTAWLDEKLNTALGSYTQLRHDYILYAKQGGSYGVPSAAAIAEPIPEFYSELRELISHLHTLLIETNLTTSRISQHLNFLAGEVNSYENIAQKVKDGIPLATLEEELLRDFGEGPGKYGNKEPMLVADIFSDWESDRVLEEGVGPFNPLLVIHELPGDNPLIFVGLVFSYYEFTQPINNRLTDQEWEALLLINPPERPLWTNSFLHLESEDILQQYDKREKWLLFPSMGWDHILDICFNGEDTFYLVVSDYDYYSGFIYGFNTTTNGLQQIGTEEVCEIEYWNNSLIEFYENEIRKIDVNGTEVAYWMIPPSNVFIQDLTIDELEKKIIVACDSTPVFYEYSMEGTLLRTWGESGAGASQFQFIYSVTADNGYLTVIDVNLGLSIWSLSSTQMIKTLTAPTTDSSVRDLHRNQDGSFFCFDPFQGIVYKLSASGQILSRWTETGVNTVPKLSSLVPVNHTQLVVAHEEINQVSGNRSFYISIYGFNHSRPTRPLVNPLQNPNPSHNITVIWTTSKDLDGVVTFYRYEIAQSPLFYPLLNNGAHADTSLFIEWLENDTIFYFRVQAYDNEGWASGWSLIVNSYVLVPGTEPLPPEPPPPTPPPITPQATIINTCLALVVIFTIITGLTYLIGRKTDDE